MTAGLVPLGVPESLPDDFEQIQGGPDHPSSAGPMKQTKEVRVSRDWHIIICTLSWKDALCCTQSCTVCCTVMRYIMLSLCYSICIYSLIMLYFQNKPKRDFELN